MLDTPNCRLDKLVANETYVSRKNEKQRKITPFLTEAIALQSVALVIFRIQKVFNILQLKYLTYLSQCQYYSFSLALFESNRNVLWCIAAERKEENEMIRVSTICSTIIFQVPYFLSLGSWANSSVVVKQIQLNSIDFILELRFHNEIVFSGQRVIRFLIP